jgi:hypothetical protein
VIRVLWRGSVCGELQTSQTPPSTTSSQRSVLCCRLIGRNNELALTFPITESAGAPRLNLLNPEFTSFPLKMRTPSCHG